MGKELLSSVRGMHDLWGTTFARHKALLSCFESVATRFGYHGIQTPLVEPATLFERATPEADVTQKELFRLVPRSEDDANALRPEGTAPTVRAILQGGHAQDKPLKLFYSGPMFRYDRPQKGRLRQFHQVGIEHLGDDTPYSDLDILQLAHDFLNVLPLTEKPTLHLNSLGDQETREAYTRALKDYLTPHRHTLSADSQRRLDTNPLRILDSKSADDQKIVANAPLLQDFYTNGAKTHFETLCAKLTEQGILFHLEPKLVRGLDYYVHTAFEFKVSALGAQSTILAGGRYDGLSELLGGPSLPGVGWAAGIERLALLCKEDWGHAKPPAFLLPCTEEDTLKAFLLAGTLRKERCAISMLTTPWPLKKRLKKISTQGGRFVLILGETEREQETVQLRDMETGEQNTLAWAAVKEALARKNA